MWRSEMKANVYEPFFTLLRNVFLLREPANFTYPTPLFDSWDGFGPLSQTDVLQPILSDVASTDTELLELENAEAVLDSDNELFPGK